MIKREKKLNKFYEANTKHREQIKATIDKACIPNFNVLALSKYLPFTRPYYYQLINGERFFKDEDVKRITKAIMKYRADALRGEVK
ncbi:MAG: hypothetical protein R3Y35_07175 [Clostridia bacterium]